MTESQWSDLKEVVKGNTVRKDLVAFIIDSPWLPGFNGISTLDYYSSGEKWFEANKKAIETFPDIIFLPGFWSEFGMCTEPSAFGSKCIWHQSSLPHADKIITDISDIQNIKKPDPRTDGLLAFITQRLLEYRAQIQNMGHEIRFAIARGPLNIASFLMGTTEFMMATVMNPHEAHTLLRVITDFTIDWLQFQKELFAEIDGIFILDDIVGFVGDTECNEFVVPYLSEIFHSFETSVRFFHNDAAGLVSSPYLEKIGVNLFNFSHEHTIKEIHKLAGPNVALLGNLPPRDVLAAGSPADVESGVLEMVQSAREVENIIWSCGGGMPPNVRPENIHTFYNTIVNLS
jgi:uroporphyrinogen decarboxylase